MKIEKWLVNRLTSLVLFLLIIIYFTLPSAARRKDFYFPELKADLYVQKMALFWWMSI